jgi:hypothetical protein
MNLNLIRKISIITFTLILLGSFAFPHAANAGLLDNLLGAFGMGLSQSSTTYDYNSTSSEHQGDLELSKRLLRIGRDQDLHEQVNIRPGDSVQVVIEVKNTSSRNVAQTVVTDEIGGNVMYVANSLTVDGTPVAGGLTSGGLHMQIPTKTKTTISYEMQVCSASGYLLRANAYAPGVGSASDGIIIKMDSNYNSYYGYGCGNSASGTNTYGSTNPFGGWTGVSNASNSSTNPFGGWTGVNNSGTTTNPNPFTGWTGVSGNTNYSSTNPFGTWTGVNNSHVTSNPNPFTGWTGVSGNSNYSSTNPFAGWTGVSNPNSGFNSNEVFGTWTGVSNNPRSGFSSEEVFGTWTGVGNNSNSGFNSEEVFGTWTGVGNNPRSGFSSEEVFGTWTGVSNNPRSGFSSEEVFGTWTGVSNPRTGFNSDDVFGQWYGVNNSHNGFSSNEVFGNWTGVNNSSTVNGEYNPFGTWTGVANDNGFDERGYSTSENIGTGGNRPISYNGTIPNSSTNTNNNAYTNNTDNNSNVNSGTNYDTVYVAPKTGVNTWGPISFAGILTLVFVAYRNRKLIFS